MADILTSFSTLKTPQNRQADSRQVQNSAGGFSFEIPPEQRLRRFLVLGTDAGSYYANAGDLTVENAKAVLSMAATDHKTLVDTVVDVSVRGAAPKANPALFVLAMAVSSGTDEERAYALDALSKVARTGTHLFLFAKYVQQFRGWGRGLRRAVGNWYLDKDVDALAYQMVKYRQREGWTHADLLRKSHPDTLDPARKALFDWATKGNVAEETPRLIEGFLRAQETNADIPSLIAEYPLSWEMLPDAALGETSTWEALITKGMPQMALIRQLPRLTRVGLLGPGRTSNMTDRVVQQLTDQERLNKARIHPVNVLNAQRTYAEGRSYMGSTTWSPNRRIIDALDEAFYKSFGSVEPAGKKTLLALDVSGSMTARVSQTSPLTARDASAALSLVQMATEPETHTIGFTSSGSGTYFDAGRGGPSRNRWSSWGSGVTELNISPRQRLDDVIRYIDRMDFGGTDCAMPMFYAMNNDMEVETVVVYTDSETWHGDIHPHQALRQYREATGIDTKLIVVGLTSNGFSIADPNDAGSLDIAGFDSAVPNLINDFSRGF